MKLPYLIYVALLIPMALGFGELSWGYTCDSCFWSHFTYHFAHSSIWHLGGNALCFWVLTRRGASMFEIGGAFLIATVCSFFAPHNLPTIGLSGVVYALCGMRLAAYRNFTTKSLLRTAIILILPGLTGKVNIALHILCIVAGYLIVTLPRLIKQIQKDVKRCHR